MPRFSVIVPVYKVQAYLHACLESVLEQSCSDLEVIAVDDCSPDASGAIADEFAARDERVRTLHLRENVGLGRARNAGLEHATGDYVLFLDSDDTLTPGALQAITDRIEATGGPDVLVYDYARTYWTGEAVRNQYADRLTQDGPAPFALADRPEILQLLMVAWNKAYRRAFVEEQGFVFPPGYYEDTPWTYPVLMSARTIATLDRVCVHYRQRRRGNILGTTSREHFDVFDQYDRVFAFLDVHPELSDAWRPLLFRRMVEHLATVFTHPDRLPRGSRPDFLRRARAHYRRYRVPGAPVAARDRLRHGLVRLGSHRTYRSLAAAMRCVRRARGLAGRLRHAARAAALQAHYRVQLRLPVRADRAVFSSYGGRGHGCNPGALESAFRTYAPHIATAWIAEPEHHHTLPSGTRALRPGTAAYWTALARSKYLVNNVDFDHRLVKRAGQVVIQTQHGTPLKKMGLDLQDHPAAARGQDFGRLLRSVDTWDYVLSANRHSTLVWERVYPSAYTTLEYGYPRNDAFHRATSRDVARARESLGIPDGATAILYAPTHRDYRRTQTCALDLQRVLRRLGTDFVVLTRAHPLHPAPLAQSAGRLIDVSGHASVESLCLAADALVTDYSSLMFDYANLDRPIVIHADDWEAYEASRGTYFDLRASPPGAVARSEDELIDIFATGHWRGSRSAQLRAAFRKRFCPYDDGRAAERVVRHVVLGEEPRSLPEVSLAGPRRAPAGEPVGPRS
ncbi:MULTISPECIES: bifunctional glycosyltransferase family 2 protein/CDP-glycerol:glycerophosphate glycerophosphotransferase [unclassified Streptomyces]|uniref:Bifunctional glycosyltransferase family 2 protein/CDP-glycerol:glycerophosphate glycerophosphotransferase n=1 Tax=Streptomyces sp. NBC_00119 TaxID=2975659 RepID=A0AAU1UDT2_9ACTN|nr:MULTISPECIES: bifunctional glycosyltransferase family 2 protein/CDP-glycerol:glycerophosphate glycerophosphotransferase [unclassified Streptomyces]MCX4645098.1 bifunctional glycosyltransferase family 2 protein/CDP-glycerol:glycerophosphate glycerophosphotransferase [Streptomyces sp. NBC_01446]MCX5326132.1 bifunctional glycosyltransferase family 2 protein/CDP-glycerol:glycerophosphate glycerophosphotransferase [Streptomyces sp. NBC_00120]